MKKILILILLFMLTGCSSYIELNDLAIINTLGLEKVNDNYKLYASIVNIKEEESLEPEIETYEIEGNSLNQIVDNLSLTLNKNIYMSHLNLLIINDTIKTQELDEIINFFINNNETREDFLVINTNNLEKVIKNSKFQQINDLVENSSRETSKTIYTTMYDVIKNYYDKESIYLPYIASDITLEGLKEFKNNTYKEIKSDDVIYLNYYLNNIDTYKYSITCHNNQNKYLYLNILTSNTSNFKNELLITNEIKIISNDCNYNQDEINNLFNNNLKSNLTKYTNKKITIKNTIRGTYEN